MSALVQFAKMSAKEMPDVVCYEKQSTWGGQWNPSWKTGKYQVLVARLVVNICIYLYTVDLQWLEH